MNKYPNLKQISKKHKEKYEGIIIWLKIYSNRLEEEKTGLEFELEEVELGMK